MSASSPNKLFVSGNRVNDFTIGDLRSRWTETGALENYRHAHVFDHIAGLRYQPCEVMVI